MMSESDIEEMLKQYLATALWTAEMDDKGIYQISLMSYAEALADVKEFLNLADSYLEDTSATPSDIGHDFWLTRNGHGVGFWDRPELYGSEGQRLTHIAHSFGSALVFLNNFDVPCIERG